MSLHPVHLTADQEGNLPPSALVPFCLYQGESDLLGRELPELDNITVCDKFQPATLEGQFCYTLDIARVTKFPRKPTKSGKINGLLLLLDPDPYHLNHTDKSAESSDMDGQNFKVFIHTLHTHTTFGPGSLAMSTLKKMTGTDSFKQGWTGKLFFSRGRAGRGGTWPKIYGAGNPPFPTVRGGAGKGSKSAGQGGAGAGKILRELIEIICCSRKSQFALH